jgi:hypothetical protein
MKRLLLFYILIFLTGSASSQVHDEWNRKTRELIRKENFRHESIRPDSLREIFLDMVSYRTKDFGSCFDTAVKYIVITEVYDFLSGKKMRKEEFIDFSKRQGCGYFFEDDSMRNDQYADNYFPEWNYYTVNKLYPRNYTFYTGSCMGSSQDLRKAKRDEKRINKDTSFIETYVRIITRIDVKKNTIDIAFFIPERGKREVTPYNGIFGYSDEGELVLTGYFDRFDRY